MVLRNKVIFMVNQVMIFPFNLFLSSGQGCFHVKLLLAGWNLAEVAGACNFLVHVVCILAMMMKLPNIIHASIGM